MRRRLSQRPAVRLNQRISCEPPSRIAPSGIAAVIRRNGTYFIKDLGSTNGIDFKGMRIDNKRIEEGDVFHLCDYELRFTYRAE